MRTRRISPPGRTPPRRRKRPSWRPQRPPRPNQKPRRGGVDAARPPKKRPPRPNRTRRRRARRGRLRRRAPRARAETPNTEAVPPRPTPRVRRSGAAARTPPGHRGDARLAPRQETAETNDPLRTLPPPGGADAPAVLGRRLRPRSRPRRLAAESARAPEAGPPSHGGDRHARPGGHGGAGRRHTRRGADARVRVAASV